MKCHACGNAEVVSEVGVHEYVEARLPYPVVLSAIPVLRCPACGEESVTIPDPEGLHEILCLHIVMANRALLPGEIRFLRRYLDKSADAMAALMGVDAKTLSRWENGRQKMGAVAERLIRVIVGNHLRLANKASPETIFPALRSDMVSQPNAVTLTPAGRHWREAA